MSFWASTRSPLSKHSSSGVTPASRIRAAMRVTLRGVFITTWSPEFIVLRSSEQMSGRKATMCSTRRSGAMSVVPAAASAGLPSVGT